MSNSEDKLWMRWKQLWKRAEKSDLLMLQSDFNSDVSIAGETEKQGISLVAGDAETIRAIGKSDTVVFEFECDRQWDLWRSRVKALPIGDTAAAIEVAQGLMEWLRQMAAILLENNEAVTDLQICESNRVAIRRLFERHVFLKPLEIISIGVLASEFLSWTSIRPEVFSLVLLQHCRLIHGEQFGPRLRAFQCNRDEYLVARNRFAEAIDVHRTLGNVTIGRENVR